MPETPKPPRRGPRHLRVTGFPASEADPVFRAVLRGARHPFLILTDDFRVHFANPAFYDRFRVSPDEAEGRPIYDIGREWDEPGLHRLLEEVLKTDGNVESYRVEHAAENRGPRFMLLDASRIEIAGRAGHIAIGITDVTELEGLREFQEKIVDAVREGLLVLDANLRVVSANQSFRNLFRVGPEETEGRLVYELSGGDWDIPELRTLLEDVLAKSSTFDDFEVKRDFRTIGPREMILNGRRIDNLRYILLAIRDVTGERVFAGQRNALMGELQHRVKNILATVSALMHQTRRRSRSLDDFADALEGRVEALSRVQDLLFRYGAARTALGDIVRQELDAHGAREGESYTVVGDEVVLRPREAQALALAVHELVTNAVRHGALKRDTGRIEISVREKGEDAGQRVHMRWSEHGVGLDGNLRPATGFGREMIERSLPYMLGGSAAVAFRDDGVECHIEFPSQRQ